MAIFLDPQYNGKHFLLTKIDRHNLMARNNTIQKTCRETAVIKRGWMNLFGSVKNIITDQGRPYTSKWFNDMFLKLKTKHF